MIASVLRFLDWFVPGSAKRTRSGLGRARMFTFAHLAGPALGSSIVFFLTGIDRAPGPQCAVIGVCICSFWILPFALKYTGSLTGVAVTSIQNLLFVTLYGAFYYGGVTSPFLPWLLVALLLGFTFLSKRTWLVLTLFLGNILLFLAAWYWHGSLPLRVPRAQLSTVGLISVFSATLYVAWMAIYYGLLLSSESKLEVEADRHRQTAALLRDEKDRAVRANRDKSIFLAKMSHELRTPLNAVIGYSDILLEDAEESEADEHRADDLRRINAAGKHLLSLVTDVLDLSKIESEKMEMRVERFLLQAVLESAASTVEPAMRKNANRLVEAIDPHLGEMVSDETRLRQILINLLGNAAKFTENGTVTLAAVRPGGIRGKWIEIDVRDTGIGISDEDRAALFKDFMQVGDPRGARREGTGLGLVLSHKLCTMMGGTITVQSEVGRGSCFSIRIPTELAPTLSIAPGIDISNNAGLAA